MDSSTLLQSALFALLCGPNQALTYLHIAPQHEGVRSYLSLSDGHHVFIILAMSYRKCLENLNPLCPYAGLLCPVSPLNTKNRRLSLTNKKTFQDSISSSTSTVQPYILRSFCDTMRQWRWRVICMHCAIRRSRAHWRTIWRLGSHG